MVRVIRCYHIWYMGSQTVALGIAVFWSAVVMGGVVTALVLPFLRRIPTQKKDRKETLYGAEAVEFNKIRESEERHIKRRPVPRIGGLTLLPTVIFIGLCVVWLTQSLLFALCIALVGAVALVGLYDDLLDVGAVRGSPWRIRKRFFILGFVALLGGVGFSFLLPGTVTFLPVYSFEGVPVGILFPVLFAVWYIFWQASSVIDGIDGLAGSIFLVLFIGTALLSFLQNHPEAFLLSSLGAGVVVPWLFVNYAPAKAYLTETGITVLLMLFAIITFLLGSGAQAGDGLWVGGIFGGVLITTWLSNVLQLVYRRRTGKKLFHIAPIHHHFEAIGIPSGAVVSWYVLVTILCVVLGLSVVFFIR